MLHGQPNVGRKAAMKASSLTGQKTATTTKLAGKGRPKTAIGLVSGPAKRRYREKNTISTKLQSQPSTQNTVDVESVSETEVTDGGVPVHNSSSSRGEDAATVLSESGDNVENAEKQGDDLKEATAELADDDEVTEVKFVVPERQQTAEEFDVRRFLADVEQLTVSLQAVVRRQAVEEFQGSRLSEMVSAVVGTMHNFQTFANRVYDSLDTVKEQMKSATDFMRQKILQPTHWHDLMTPRGKSHCVSFNLVN